MAIITAITAAAKATATVATKAAAIAGKSGGVLDTIGNFKKTISGPLKAAQTVFSKAVQHGGPAPYR